MRPISLLRAFSLVCASALLAPLAGAQNFYDGFESYPTGSLLHGQGGWRGWNGPTDHFTRVTEEFAFTGVKSAHLRPDSDIVQRFDHHAGKWIISAQTRIDSDFAGSNWLVFMNEYNEGGGPFEWGGQLELDSITGQATCDCGGVGNFVAPLVGGWAEVRLELDLDLDLATISYNGQLMGSWVWTTGASGMENHATPGFEALDLWNPGGWIGTAYVDDVRVELVEVGTPFCDADGQGSACPCGNEHDGSQGVSGCANGSEPAGARLRGSGSTSLTADTLALWGFGVSPGQPGLFFQGDDALAGGDGVPFGDGLRCVGTNVIRIQVVAANAAGQAATSVDVGATGGASPAETKHYQLWYRDPQGSLCGSAFNLTNALSVAWQP